MAAAEGPPVESLRVLGVDEAGRGSWLGPLVVGAFCVRAHDLPRLQELGVRDSKLLPRARREAIYRELRRVGTCASVTLHPERIDRFVDRGQLNRLEASAFAALVRRLHPDEAFLDSCDPVPSRFAGLVARLAGGATRVSAAHHADRDFPVVSAASIVAKVRRDRALSRLARSIGGLLGSGYPSDRRTVEYMRAALRLSGPLPVWLRRSWATTERIISERSARTLDEFGVE